MISWVLAESRSIPLTLALSRTHNTFLGKKSPQVLEFIWISNKLPSHKRCAGTEVELIQGTVRDSLRKPFVDTKSL